MAIKALIFGTDDLFPQLKPFYDMEVKRGNLEIVGYAVLENNQWRIYANSSGGGASNADFQIAIISSQHNFYHRMKFLEAQKIPRKNIIDGRVFRTSNFDFLRLLNEGIAYGIFENCSSFQELTFTLYPRIYRFKNNGSILTLGRSSYFNNPESIIGGGIINTGSFCSIAANVTFEMGINNNHNYKNISTFEPLWLSWIAPPNFFETRRKPNVINIGNDVWIGNGSIIKSSNPERPLIIGEGAVIAADSVVVKNVPPYAIVGGNPARIIKYRFSEDIIEALLRIKWWNWDIDKIYENYKYFNRIEEFVAMHDK